ncbi:hypothetical protein C7212DRAFT_349881 [Tuber magnatum]|uniref:Uncharacterized protein n=1 Tax=Tuber magnatum TaxID=42249 RepID=A0A317SZR2_9PEZI|nr:hypothetical protein C7212DRAFT_349881 [Tuber magnatum]
MSYHPTARSSTIACHTSYPLTDEEIASAPAIYTPVIRPTHISTSYADSTCSSNSDVSPFFYEGIWLEGPDVPQDASTEQTPLLSAPVTFDPELDGFQVNTTGAVSLKSGDLESGPLAQVEEVVGAGEEPSTIMGGVWRWVLRIFQRCGLVSATEAGNGNE